MTIQTSHCSHWPYQSHERHLRRSSGLVPTYVVVWVTVPGRVLVSASDCSGNGSNTRTTAAASTRPADQRMER
ncbi:MAG: hypothetical protein OXI56_07825 [bacterium]|nr:hypothetical protein [bacterium]